MEHVSLLEGKCGVRPQSVEKRLSILHPPDVSTAAMSS